MQPSLLLPCAAQQLRGPRVAIMVHARGTPDLFCVFPARYITYVCTHNAVQRRGRTGKIDEAERDVSHYPRAYIHLRGTRLILGAEIPSIWRREVACLPSQDGEKGTHSFSSAFTTTTTATAATIVATEARTRYAVALNLEWFMRAQNDRAIVLRAPVCTYDIMPA